MIYNIVNRLWIYCISETYSQSVHLQAMLHGLKHDTFTKKIISHVIRENGVNMYKYLHKNCVSANNSRVCLNQNIYAYYVILYGTSPCTLFYGLDSVCQSTAQYSLQTKTLG